MSEVRLRFVDVEVTEPLFAGSSLPYTQLHPAVELEPGERIVAVSDHHKTSGTMGSYIAVVARVWICVDA